MVKNIDKYFVVDPDSYYEKDGKKCWHSVHGKSYSRYNKAKSEITKPIVSREKTIELVNNILKAANLKDIENPIFYNPSDIDYKKLKKDYELDEVRDIVWIKFTKSGFVGVVAMGNDINFDIPQNSDDYDKKIRKFNKYKKEYKLVWKHTSSGILVHKLGQEWDESFVLIFPLSKLKDSCNYSRHQIEVAIGNYLIDNEVPIIDYYSHNISRINKE